MMGRSEDEEDFWRTPLRIYDDNLRLSYLGWMKMRWSFQFRYVSENACTYLGSNLIEMQLIYRHKEDALAFFFGNFFSCSFDKVNMYLLNEVGEVFET